jgi:hypothetical protein
MLGKILDLVEEYIRVMAVMTIRILLPGRQRLMTNTREQLKDLDPESRLARCGSEVGYATKPGDRLKQHLDHKSSNYLMNLTDSICKRFSNYKINQYVTFLTAHPAHAMFAEILASRIGLAYTTQGGGVCHHPAGQSHGGITDIGAEVFEELQQYLQDDPRFISRAQADMKAMDDKTKFYEDFTALIKKEENFVGKMDAMATKLDGRRLELEKIAKDSAQEYLTETDGIARLLDVYSMLQEEGGGNRMMGLVDNPNMQLDTQERELECRYW